MERISQNSQGYKLESQIREAYGRVTYTQTCHDKIISRLMKTNDRIKIWQIVLSAITTSGFIVAILSEDKIASVLGAIISLVLLILNSYTKNFNLVEKAQEHKVASDTLWKIREEYVSLLLRLIEFGNIISISFSEKVCSSSFFKAFCASA